MFFEYLLIYTFQGIIQVAMLVLLIIRKNEDDMTSSGMMFILILTKICQLIQDKLPHEFKGTSTTRLSFLIN